MNETVNAYMRDAMIAGSLCDDKLGKPNRDVSESATVGMAICHGQFGQVAPRVNAYSIGDEDGELDGSRVFSFTMLAAHDDEIREAIFDAFYELQKAGDIYDVSWGDKQESIEVIIESGKFWGRVTAWAH